MIIYMLIIKKWVKWSWGFRRREDVWNLCSVENILIFVDLGVGFSSKMFYSCIL